MSNKVNVIGAGMVKFGKPGKSDPYQVMASGAARAALKDAGINVPGHLSVVGVDDIPMSAMVQPTLTTVAIPKELSGRASIDLLMQLFDEPSSPAPPIELLPTSLVVRGTTAPPPGAPVSSDTTAQPTT